MRIVAGLIGSRQFYEPFATLHRHGSLVRFITDLWVPPESLTMSIARRCCPALAMRIKARHNVEIPNDLIMTVPEVGIAGAALLRLHLRRSLAYKAHELLGRQFARRCAQFLTIDHDMFVGYTSAALEAFDEENRRGGRAILIQIDAAEVHERILQNEAALHPKFVSKPHDSIPGSYFARIREEWAAAQRILVNSKWSQMALEEQGVPTEKLRVVPLAYRPAFKPSVRRPPRDGPLRVLWLGNMSLGKGLAYALLAARILIQEKISFTFAGNLEAVLSDLPQNCRFIGHVPRVSVSKIYAQHDVLIFPTLSDGFGLVQVEAMAHGLPVIATSNCGDVVQDCKCGFVVPTRDADSLAAALLKLHRDRDLLMHMSLQALRRADDFTPKATWAAYSTALMQS